MRRPKKNQMKAKNLLKIALSTVLLWSMTSTIFAAEAKDPALVFGHKNPDTDAIVGALSAANLYQGRGINVKAVAQGAVAPETDFVLKHFKIKHQKL